MLARFLLSLVSLAPKLLDECDADCAEEESCPELHHTSVVRTCPTSSRSSCGLDVVEHLLGSATDDTASHGQVSALLQEQIDLTSSLATFIDAPANNLLVPCSPRRDEG